MFEWCDACSCLAEAAQVVTERQILHCRTLVHASHLKEGSLAYFFLLELILHSDFHTNHHQALLRLTTQRILRLVNDSVMGFLVFFCGLKWLGFEEPLLFVSRHYLSCIESVKFSNTKYILFVFILFSCREYCRLDIHFFQLYFSEIIIIIVD